MKKEFISANELLENSFKLADQIYRSGFKPQFIVGVWRGGAPVGIAVQEYLDYRGIVSDHIAIRTAAYTGIDTPQKMVQVFGLNYVIDRITAETALLIVDDVFDSGRSLKAIIDQIQLKAGDNTPKIIKTACPWYKPARNTTSIKPDFYIYETDAWLVLPHEFKGLTADEIKQGKPPLLTQLLDLP